MVPPRAPSFSSGLGERLRQPPGRLSRPPASDVAALSRGHQGGGGHAVAVRPNAGYRRLRERPSPHVSPRGARCRSRGRGSGGRGRLGGRGLRDEHRAAGAAAGASSALALARVPRRSEARDLRRGSTLYARGRLDEAAPLFAKHDSLEAKVGAAFSTWPEGTYDRLEQLAKLYPEIASSSSTSGWRGCGRSAATRSRPGGRRSRPSRTRRTRSSPGTSCIRSFRADCRRSSPRSPPPRR